MFGTQTASTALMPSMATGADFRRKNAHQLRMTGINDWRVSILLILTMQGGFLRVTGMPYPMATLSANNRQEQSRPGLLAASGASCPLTSVP